MRIDSVSAGRAKVACKVSTAELDHSNVVSAAQNGTWNGVLISPFVPRAFAASSCSSLRHS